MASLAAIASLPAWLAVVVIGVGLVAAVVIYFLPFIIAETRNVPHVGSVFVVNLFFGWSLIGWVVALAMAMRSKAVPPVTLASVQQSSDRPVAGWYPDPTTGESRWWDGNRWGPTRVREDRVPQGPEPLADN